MLAAVILTGANGEYIVRPLADMSKEKVTEMLETFTSHKERIKDTKGIITTKIGNFFYQNTEEYTMAVLGDTEDTKTHSGLSLLEVGIKSVNPSFSLDQHNDEVSTIISLIDNLFTQEGVVSIAAEDLTKIITMQSNDEQLHIMMQKSKEKEIEKAQKMHKKIPVLDELSKEIEEIRMLKEELKEVKISSPKQKPSALSRAKSVIDSADKSVCIISHVKQTSTVNSSTEQSKTEGTGEILLKITDENMQDIRIDIKKKPSTSRAHPSVDKKAFSSGTILPRESIPLDRVLTLLKWTEESPSLPLEVSFWQSELSEERYKFFVEVTAFSPIKHLFISVPIKRVSDIDVKEGQIKGDYITAETENLEVEESFSMEFSGLCDDTTTLFPFTLSYIQEEQSTNPVFISSIYTSSSSEPLPPESIFMRRIVEGECTVTNE